MISCSAKLLVGFFVCLTAMTFARDASKNFPADRPSRLSIRHIERGGIGYNQGYTTFEGFFAPDPSYPSALLPFLDVRAHIFDDGKAAANAGLGLRKIIGHRVYGLNAYYDYRKSHNIHYNQVGFGLETLGKRWDFRINGYLPVGRKTPPAYATKFAEFSGNRLMLLQKYKFAMKGFNAELGVHFGKSRLLDFYAAAGPYYLRGKNGPHIWGGKVRLLCKIKEYLTLELSNSYDKMFKDRFQGQITLTIPFGRGSDVQTDDCTPCAPSNILLSRMVQPVERQEIIIEGCRKRKNAAIDPLTGLPFNVIFVDNTSHSLGTYESPYPTLALAQANSTINDIIYVFPGDGTTKGMDEGITLKYNQKFWGSGVDHSLQTAQGAITIPAQSSSAPRMTNLNTDGDGITLSSRNEISGFTITNASNNGIFGTNLENIRILHTTIDSSLFDQIHLEYSSSPGSADLENLTLSNGGLYGIFIDSQSATMACNINNCTIQDTTNFAINASFVHEATVNMIGNTIARNNNPANFSFADTASLVVFNNTFNNNTAINLAPISVSAGVSPLTALISKNTITDNTCSAIHFVLNDTRNAQLMVSQNIITNNDTGSIGFSFGAPLFIDAAGSSAGNCYLNLMENNFSRNTGPALTVANGAFNELAMNATGNTINANGGGLGFATPSNTFSLHATNNTIINNGNHGITTSGGIIIAKASMNIANNNISGNTNQASALAVSHEGTDLTFNVTNNNLSDNEGSGIIMYSSGTIENLAMNISGNTVSNNQNLGSNASPGIDIEQYTNLSGNLTNNTFSNNAGSAVYIGSTVGSPAACLVMTGNSSDTDYVFSSGAGSFNLAPCDVGTANVGTITTPDTITLVESCPAGAPCAL